MSNEKEPDIFAEARSELHTIMGDLWRLSNNVKVRLELQGEKELTGEKKQKLGAFRAELEAAYGKFFDVYKSLLRPLP